MLFSGDMIGILTWNNYICIILKTLCPKGNAARFTVRLDRFILKVILILVWCVLFSVERDPKKRRVKPVGPAHQSLLDFDLGESSDDSDFRIEDHFEESDDDSIDSDDDGGGRGKSL